METIDWKNAPEEAEYSLYGEFYFTHKGLSFVHLEGYDQPPYWTEAVFSEDELIERATPRPSGEPYGKN